MPLIVDGHNLVPKIPGINLEDDDDEVRLIELLQTYCRVRRKQVEVYFDKAPYGHPRVQKFGAVTALFARPGKTADDEIKGKMDRLGRSARNWTVVSSDGSVQAAARGARAEVITSDEFAHELEIITKDTNSLGKSQEQNDLTSEELAMWLELFGGERTDEKPRKR